MTKERVKFPPEQEKNENIVTDNVISSSLCVFCHPRFDPLFLIENTGIAAVQAWRSAGFKECWHPPS